MPCSPSAATPVHISRSVLSSTIAKVPSVCIDPHLTPTSGVSKLHVPVAFNGVEIGGNCYRMDNVPIDCRKVVEPPEGMLTDEQFLIKVRDRLKKLKGVA